MEWVEIPAQRLLHVSNQELLEFEMRGDPGTERLFVRHDGRVFRYAAVQPPDMNVIAHCYLAEV